VAGGGSVLGVLSLVGAAGADGELGVLAAGGELEEPEGLE
jgi:hypothetical protein